MIRGSSGAFAAALAVLAAGSAATASGDDTLKVCLDANIPPWSMHNGASGAGFDPAVAEAIAARLGQKVTIQWFETKLDQDSSTTLVANALLSDRLCQLVGGFPLLDSAFDRPQLSSTRMPDYEGARPSDRRRSVELGVLVPSRAYQFAALTIVLGAAAASERITDLSGLEGLKLGVEGGTLADAILMLFGDGRFANQITHVIPGRDELLRRLEKDEYDATLVELRRFDAYRAEHPDTKLALSGYYYPIGFNIGFSGLSTAGVLMEKVDRSIGDMLDSGEMAALARAAGVTYLPPRHPNISPAPTISDLRRN